MRKIILVAQLALLWFQSIGQETNIEFEKYNPKSTLVVPEHPTLRAKFPFIDIHSHQWQMPTQDLSTLIRTMDSMNMAVMNNLSGSTGRKLVESIKNINANYPDRFIVFANIQFDSVGAENWTENTVAQLEQDFKNGAKGLKIFESLGTYVKDVNGNRVSVDDTRLDAIWEKCGKLKMPVLIHTAAPIAFWSPFDEKNERWLELKLYPNRRRTANSPAPFYDLIAEQHRMFKKHPNTTFIAAHFDWHANNLSKLSDFLNDMPNVYIEFGAVIAELARQPREAKRFFEKYQDRILFGKDSWVPNEYPTYFRVLETEDEYFPYHKKYHAYWNLYGLGLSDEILKKIYYKNALKIIPKINRNLFPKD